MYQFWLNLFIICAAVVYSIYLLYTDKKMREKCGSSRFLWVISYKPYIIKADLPHLLFITFVFIFILISGYFYGYLSFFVMIPFSISLVFNMIQRPCFGENKLKIGRKLYEWEDINNYTMKFDLKDNINYPDGTFHVCIKGLPKEIIIHVQKSQKERVMEILDQYIKGDSK
jgi:hypothetical protein